MKIDARPRIELQVTIVLSEEEARAIDALAGYGDDQFIKVFYEHLGRGYMEKHEVGLRSFLKTAREEIPRHLSNVDAARKVFTGEYKGVRRK